jgi:hypothetical protein
MTINIVNLSYLYALFDSWIFCTIIPILLILKAKTPQAPNIVKVAVRTSRLFYGTRSP